MSENQYIRYIANEQHYNVVLAQVANVKRSLWIGTADIKDLYVKTGQTTQPFLGIIAQLLRRGVEVRLMYAKEPGPIFKTDFDKYPILARQLERVLCPRIHFKIMVFDLQTIYVGSANLTGAGIGMKSKNRRNFEAGILTNEPNLVDVTMNQYDNVWNGSHCKTCGRKAFCTDRIV